MVAKVVAKGLGDGSTIDLFAGAPNDAAGIVTVLTIENGVDGTTYRHCTRFAVDDGSTVIFKEIAGGTGRKLIARSGVGTPCPS